MDLAHTMTTISNNLRRQENVIVKPNDIASKRPLSPDLTTSYEQVNKIASMLAYPNSDGTLHAVSHL